jgi:cobalt-zinc-cadmium efflux system outer membrane protein
LWAAVLTGCASVDPAPTYDRAAQEIRTATGAPSVYNPNDESGLPEREAELLANGLELREAVELGLLRNPFLQASFRSVGIAEADRVQAGLLTNPSLSAALRFPAGGGQTQLEGGLFGNLADIWQAPARTRVAESALERAVLELAYSAVQLSGKIRTAYIEVLAAERLFVIAQENRDSAARLVELVGARLKVSAATAIDSNLAKLEFLDTEVMLRDAEFDVAEGRRVLATLLGYDRVPLDLTLSGALPGAADALPGVEPLRDLARERRLDIRAAHARLEEAVADLHRQHGLVVKVVQAGIEVERDGDWALGPGIRLELPIFDQNQAQIARAVEALAQHEALLRAVSVSAAQDVSSVFARAEAQWDVVRIYGDQVDRARETLELSIQSYEVGRTTLIPVIAAQRKLLSARRKHVLRLRAAASAVSDLERATGTPREELLEAGQVQVTKQL